MCKAMLVMWARFSLYSVILVMLCSLAEEQYYEVHMLPRVGYLTILFTDTELNNIVLVYTKPVNSLQ